MGDIAYATNKGLERTSGYMRLDIARLKKRLEVFYLGLVSALLDQYYHNLSLFTALGA